MSVTTLKAQGRGRDARLRRHTRALMDLAQRLWQTGDGLQTALSAITETAAHVLEVDRVNVWQFETDGMLRCVHSYDRGTRTHNPPGFDEQLAIGTAAYLKTVPRVRVFLEVAGGDAVADADPLAAYLHRRGIRSLIVRSRSTCRHASSNNPGSWTWSPRCCRKPDCRRNACASKSPKQR